LERWLLSKLQQRIATVTSGLDELKTRTALQVALFETWNDIRWYVQRKGKADSQALNETVTTWLQMLAPFAPFTCEEVWSRGSKAGFISVAKWPTVEPRLMDVAAEEQENLIGDLVDDTLNILKATKISPKKVFVYTAAKWKWQVYLKILERATSGEVKIGEVMRELAAEKDLKVHMKEAANLVPRIVKALMRLSTERKANRLKTGATDEEVIIGDAVRFLRERFNADVSVYREDDVKRYDPKGRASLAMPGQPAIFIE
jgi:leucyl-tRNA synthetase